MATTSFQSAEINLELPHDADVPLPFQLLLDGVAVDLTGDSVRLIVKDAAEDVAILIDITQAVHTAPLLGQTTVNVADTDTVGLLAAGQSFRTMVYELRHVELDRPWFKGAFRIVRTVGP